MNLEGPGLDVAVGSEGIPEAANVGSARQIDIAGCDRTVAGDVVGAAGKSVAVLCGEERGRRLPEQRLVVGGCKSFLQYLPLGATSAVIRIPSLL